MRSRQDFFSHAFFKKKKKTKKRESSEKKIAAFSGGKKGYSVDTFYTKSIVSVKTLPVKRIVQDQAEH